jgi:hypothetical protein
MATKSPKRVEVISPLIRATNEDAANFKKVLQTVCTQKFGDEFKDHEINLLTTDLEDCVVGIVITGQNKNLPPKKDKATGAHSKLGINPSKENLSYGNIFLYSDTLNVLFYEVNVNGCYPDKLAEHIMRIWNHPSQKNRIELSFNPVSRKGEYQRLLKMTNYREVYAAFANPAEILQEYKDDNDSTLSMVKRYLKDGLNSNSDKLIVNFATFSKKNNKTGLSRQRVMKFVNSVRYLLNGNQRKNVTALKVLGYFTDPDSPKSKQPINLIADTFNIFIRLTNVTLLEDLQLAERKSEIERLYSRHLPELKLIFKRG